MEPAVLGFIDAVSLNLANISMLEHVSVLTRRMSANS